MDQRLETFLTVCSTMNYRRAAERLHLTQPAVTKQIQALEALYGVRLFTYDSRKLKKTPQGETLEIYAISQRYQDGAAPRAQAAGKDEPAHRRDEIHRRLYSAAADQPISQRTGQRAVFHRGQYRASACPTRGRRA